MKHTLLMGSDKCLWRNKVWLLAFATVLVAWDLQAQTSRIVCPTCPNGSCTAPTWQPARIAIPEMRPNSTATPWKESVCRVKHSVGRSLSIGSGTLLQVAGQRFVLTCAHLFGDGNGTVLVEFPSGRKYQGKLVDVDDANDLAAIEISTSSEVCRTVGNLTPQGPLTACGYGSNGQYACVHGAIAGYATPQGTSHPSILIRGAVRSGDSGGGVFDVKGSLVGVIWGTRERLTYATFGMPLKSFLSKVVRTLNRKPSQGGTRIAGRPVNPGVSSPFSGKVKEPATIPINAPPIKSPLSTEASFQKLNRRLADLESRVDAWPKVDELVCHADLDNFAQADDLNRFVTDQQLVEFESRSKSEHSQVIERLRTATREMANATKQAAIEAATQSVSDKVGLLSGLSATKMLVGAVGLGSPLGIAVAVGFGLLRFGRTIKSRKQMQTSGSQSDSESLRSAHQPRDEKIGRQARPQTIAVDSPPIIRNALPETHYVPFERDEFPKAYQWASEQVARKYPGSVDTLTALDSLIKQQVNAQQEH